MLILVGKYSLREAREKKGVCGTEKGEPTLGDVWQTSHHLVSSATDHRSRRNFFRETVR